MDTFIVTCAVTEPPLLLAVSVYVVVCAGLTVTDDALATLPTPLSMLTAVAPVTDHESVAFWPLEMPAGLAVKEEIAGAGVGVGVGFGVGLIV